MSLKKISEEVVHQNPWWKVVHDVFEKPDGSHGDYYYGTNYGEGFALIIPVTPDGKIMLIRQYRYLKDKMSVQFPGGGIDENETASEAAARELKEETGYAAEELINVGSFESSCGLLKDEGHVFIATKLKLVDGKIPETTGDIELVFRRPDEFEEMILRGEIWDGQAIAAWMLVRKRLLENV